MSPHASTDREKPVIVWFRDDLRLADHPALHDAIDSGRPVIAVYVLDEETGGVRPLGGAARWWLHGALAALRAQLNDMGGTLLTFAGPAPETLDRLADISGAGALYCHYRYQKEARDQDSAVFDRLAGRRVEIVQRHGTLLRAPDAVRTKTGTPYRVFGAYWKAAVKLGPPPRPLAAPGRIRFWSSPTHWPKTMRPLDEDALLPRKPNWAGGLEADWTPGEAAGREILRDFVTHALAHYDTGRNEMAAEGSSRLSPYLRFGHVSPRQVWDAVSHIKGTDAEVFRGEIGWREFAWNTLYHAPDLPHRNLKPRFDIMRWRRDEGDVRAWQQGRTGIPIVDAGMRQLWETGWMHNRARMITASLLVKHLLIDWRVGEAWFWDTLVDADPANNAVNWQWVAGTGIEATPFFRVFSPLRQCERFDPDGDYMRRWVPELAKLTGKEIPAPWTLSQQSLRQAGVTLGKTYPEPIVDLDGGRQRALDALKATARTREDEAA
ncbi:deoxyribodipyrimidine photolyase [Neoasaia chiangmaiensis NBRC 101099]|uniref:Deoxyribodipyrimidine photo-lyase n=1 Tax=Neoasaia chiangmaiensis TaxID=320497 RepID=A0A1U9KUH6_9PROT|nr:deoxyribodipyrimidine photo-lyase [Neoasaia chiangmaiensis]AQS89445.1 deoxyribodipyrimidine photolyase [Neoasaia chiangmaiensis]GBR39568.1 deoxyribodipyrimidine photolyase [Neoasaia chiangmaiensis NBRC 101099]GEN14644.1 deoxyribodipyrimidine photo-lyase [Neoasaia chiangmaiensis]